LRKVELKGTVEAEKIVGGKPVEGKVDCQFKLEVEGDEKPIVLSNDWIFKNLPQPGDYLIKVDDKYYVMTAELYQELFQRG